MGRGKVTTNKSEIDARVVIETGLPTQTVSLITSVFLTEITEKLAQGTEVYLTNFGRFKVYKQGGATPAKMHGHTNKLRVSFSKAHKMKEVLHNRRFTDGKVWSR